MPVVAAEHWRKRWKLGILSIALQASGIEWPATIFDISRGRDLSEPELPNAWENTGVWCSEVGLILPLIVIKSHVSPCYAWLARNGTQSTTDGQGSAHQDIEEDRDLVKSTDVLKLVKARDFSKVRSAICITLKALVILGWLYIRVCIRCRLECLA